MTCQTIQNIRSEFARFAARPDEELDLLEGALLVAREEYPELSESAVRREIDRLSEELTRRITPDLPPIRQARALVELLFRDEGYHGDEKDFYNPDNSFLNVVLETRKGIPISLALLYIQVGRRAQLKIEGLNAPSHFLVKLQDERDELIIDPFCGKILSENAFEERLRHSLQLYELPPEQIIEYYRQPAGVREILRRMLSNLKHIYVERKEIERALGTSERILLLVPDDAEEYLHRAVFYEHLDCPGAAIADYERFIEMAPDHSLSSRVRHNIAALKRRAAPVH